MENKIKHQLFFAQPAEMVWEYLVNPELMELWLMKNDFRPVVGHDFQFRTKPRPELGFDGIVYCQVLEIVPFKRLSYSWKLGPGDDSTTIDSVVVWELKATAKGTELILDHDFALMENLAMFNGMNEGWLKNMYKIADRLNTANHDTTNA